MILNFRLLSNCPLASCQGTIAELQYAERPVFADDEINLKFNKKIPKYSLKIYLFD